MKMSVLGGGEVIVQVDPYNYKHSEKKIVVASKQWHNRLGTETRK